jgi:hypothetical protein
MYKVTYNKVDGCIFYKFFKTLDEAKLFASSQTNLVDIKYIGD